MPTILCSRTVFVACCLRLRFVVYQKGVGRRADVWSLGCTGTHARTCLVAFRFVSLHGCAHTSNIVHFDVPYFFFVPHVGVWAA